MPQPTTSLPLVSGAAIPPTGSNLGAPLGSRFTDQLRAVTATQTISLGAMVEAHGGAVTVAGPTATSATSATSSLGTADDRKIAAVTGFALAQQGKPYVFGTSGPDTFDCSGLMTAAYKKAGIDMPAYTFTQATYGRAVDTTTEAIKPGDLVFVRGGRPPTDLGHVGMAISATEWVVAPHTGDVVKVQPLPLDRVQVVRRLVG
jgi:cell wall-associated NlpC family hydrolase